VRGGGPVDFEFPPFAKSIMESAKFGFWTGYGNCLTIHASTAGLHLKVWPIFSLGHPPLFLPASEIRNAHRRNFFGIARVRFQVGDQTITLRRRVFEATGLPCRE
jgi:hypothetical protein